MVDEGLGQVNVEGELTVVIRRTCRRLRPGDVPSAILGYTIGNDVTAVEQTALDDKLTQAKHGDGFTPLDRGSRRISTPETCRSRCASTA